MFQSEATTLVPEDTNELTDIFVYDRVAQTIERVSVAADGNQGDGASFAPAISADGRWVAFWSFATNLVPDDTETCGKAPATYNCADIFVRDRETGTTERIRAVGRRGLGSGDHRLDLSADGRRVVFYTRVGDVGYDETTDTWGVFLHDRAHGTTELVSLTESGSPGNGDSVAPSISADGQRVAFVSWASDLVVDDTNGAPDVFVYDHETGQVHRASVSSNGTEGNGASGLLQHQQGWSGGPALSADGRWVAFASNADNLVTEDTHRCEDPVTGPHNCYDVFLHDWQEKTTRRVSVAYDGKPGDGESHAPAISATGRWVVFVSSAANLVLDDTNTCPYTTFARNCPDIFVYDRQTQHIERVSLAHDDVQANDASYAPSISSDGRWITFSSLASNLVDNDTNDVRDIFIRDRSTGETERVRP